MAIFATCLQSCFLNVEILKSHLTLFYSKRDRTSTIKCKYWSYVLSNVKLYGTWWFQLTYKNTKLKQEQCIANCKHILKKAKDQ